MFHHEDNEAESKSFESLYHERRHYTKKQGSAAPRPSTIEASMLKRFQGNHELRRI